MSKLKLFLLNKKLISKKNLLINYFLGGIRSKNSLIILFGSISVSYKRTSKINIKKGFFNINAGFRSKEPFIGFIELGNNSEINVQNTFSKHSGCHIIVLDKAKLNFGSGYINRNFKIRCFKEITIGENVAISENVTIWDSDSHAVLGKESEMTQPVTIGDQVWIGNNVTILKGVTIGKGSIIAAGSLVNKNVPPYTLAGGVPAKVLRENVAWK